MCVKEILLVFIRISGFEVYKGWDDILEIIYVGEGRLCVRYM